MQLIKDYAIRALLEPDLPTVLNWRNSERIRRTMYSDERITWENHAAWFERLQGDPSRRFYIVEWKGRPVGTVNFTGIDNKHRTCDWGIYLGETDVPRGSGTALGLLGLETAFERLQIRKVCAEVLAFNEASLRFHRRLGFEQEGRLRRHVWKNDHDEDVCLFAFFSDQWPEVRQKLTVHF
ncbi:UDP-4-amino-4,6-dideoxy-N-acetyl-beta-L-altrosamine N-acetyltransferase [Paenibacillus humicola]|uniref:UDP-4-amino-4, 6-dideoxy-N-acetyl-beta-L-altrosamine N-acetyltransferase n=1 Tax=Paenibacillus humicola TaxID=3110540 RepID=UPI00237B777B|nr:UDP-4-amino-4,6-dideoxy-N-acetyl-beta-L-altrosamine N-acetyltransferase [Paenibacillus humicola]